jgi:hypothetical protein
MTVIEMMLNFLPELYRYVTDIWYHPNSNTIFQLQNNEVFPVHDSKAYVQGVYSYAFTQSHPRH